MKQLLIIITFLITPFAYSSERIISLSPAITEIIYMLGKGDSLVGRSEVCDYPDSVKKVPVVGKFCDPVVEKVIELKPTIIISNDLFNPNVKKTFEKLNIKIELIQIQNMADYAKCIKHLGEILNAEQQANIELKKINDKLSNPLPEQNIKILWVIWDSPLMVAGSNSFLNEMIVQSGGKNVASEISQPYFQCSFDWLLEQDIDLIIWSGSPNGWKKHRYWDNIKAVKTNNIISNLNEDLFLRAGPRMFEGITILNNYITEFNEKK